MIVHCLFLPSSWHHWVQKDKSWMDLAQVAQKRSDTNLANCCRGVSAVFEVIRRLNMGRKDVIWGTSKARKLWSDDEDRGRTAGPGPRPGSLGRGEPSWADYFMTLDTDLHNSYTHRHVIFSLWILEKRINLSLSKPELRESDNSWAGATHPGRHQSVHSL